MNMDNDSAFDPLLDATVDVTTERRADGAVTVQRFALPCDVRAGASPGMATQGMAHVTGELYTVTFRRQAWGIPQDPATGDVYQHEVYGRLYAQSVQRDGLFWQVQCVARMGARAS